MSGKAVPPDPDEEHVNALVAAGILDPRALTEPYTNGQTAAECSAETTVFGSTRP
jgi:hypothetical protein